jgi:hypothetical protein
MRVELNKNERKIDKRYYSLLFLHSYYCLSYESFLIEILSDIRLLLLDLSRTFFSALFESLDSDLSSLLADVRTRFS